MKGILLQNFSWFSEIGTVLLAVIPALLNLVMLVYALLRLPRNALTYTFALTVFALFGWQCTDVLMRIIQDPVTAETWHEALWPTVLLVTPAGLHFTLLFTERVRSKHQAFWPILLYVPMVVYDFCNRVGLSHLPLEYDPVWGFVQGTDYNWIGYLQLAHIAAYSILILTFLWQYRSKLASHNIRRQQATWIFIGFLVPIVQGIITQLLMPHAFGMADIPLTSLSMSAFTLSIFIALSKYLLFGFEPRYAAEQILSNMNDGVCVVNSSGQIRFANARFCAITGYSLGELKDQRLFDFIRPTDPLTQGQLYVNRSNEKGGSYRIHFTNKSGASIYSLWLEAPLRLTQRNLSGWIITITDISQLELTEEQLRLKNKELSTFFYRTSHDLRGPLSSILGLINVLQQSRPEADFQKEVVQMLRTSAVKLDRVLDELIRVAVIQEEELQEENINLEELVTSTLTKSTNGQALDSSKVNITIQAGDPIVSVPDLLDPILTNLLQNALQYYQGDGSNHQVTVNLKIDNDRLLISVKDNGVGIPKDLQSRVFDMFYRGHQRSQGPGLGLYIVKNAVSKLNGSIKVHSEPGIRTLIQVSLPIKREQKLSSGLAS